MVPSQSVNGTPTRETFPGPFLEIQNPGAGNGVRNNSGSAAGTSVTAGLPPTAAGSLSQIDGQTLNVPQAATGSLGNMQTASCD